MSNTDNTLLHNLEKNNMLSLTKSYLQNKLLDTLKSQTTTYSSLIKTSDQKMNSNINSLIRLSFSLISDFLSKMNLTYSLSAFNNESKDLFSNTFIKYTESEIINLLNINIMEIEHLKKSISLTTKDSFSSNHGNLFSSTFLFYLLEKNSHIFKQDVECQTDSNLLNSEKKYNNNFSSIEEKLKQIEDKNNKKINLQEILSFQLTENKFKKYKEECDKRYEEQLNNEINRFKNFELSEMRIEENKKYSQKILQLREDYEKEFKEREERLKKELDELKERELQLEKEYEMKLNQDRIKIENIINILKNKENSFDIKYKNELDELKTQKENLKLKEKEINLIKEAQNSKINNEIEKFKNDYDKTMNDKKRKIEEERENTSKERIQLNNLLNKNNNFIYIRDDTSLDNNDNNKEIRNEIDSLKKNINDIKNKYSQTISENSELKETINKINRNLPIYQTYNQNNNNSTPLIENDLSNKKEIPIEYQKMMEKNENEINALKHSIKELKKEIKNSNKNPKNYNNIEENNTLYLSSGNFQNLNQTMPIKKSEMINQNIKNDNNQIKNKIQNQNKKISILTPNILKKLADFQDRRKNLEQFEQERYKLNLELRKQFNHILNEQAPIVIVNKEILENSRKKNIYDNLGYVNEDNKINYLDNLQNNYRIPNQKEQDRQVILVNNKIPNEQIQNNKYDNNKHLNNESYNKEISNNYNNHNEIKNETLEKQDSNKNEKIFNPNYKENSIHDHINNTRYENTNVNNSDDKNEKNYNNENPQFENIDNIQSTLSNNKMKNSENVSIENITNESKEIPKNSFSNNNSNRKSDINSQPLGIGGILSNNYNINKQPSNNSIQEEINESIGNSKINNKSMNKFQNVDYQNYNDSENKDEIEEYNDFNYDVSGDLDKKSNDKKNVGSNNKVNISNISGIMKNSMKESETATNYDKLIPLKKNNEIEENIEKDSMSYNDFETSNNLKKKGITGNSSSNNQVKTISEGEIQEEIINSESGET